MPQTHDPNRLIEATMIQGTNVNIGPYANLNMINHQVNEVNVDKRYALNLLSSNCSLSALVDANERYESPRCAEATRREIIQKMEDWVRGHDSFHGPSGIFWLHGGAGVGKSALAQTLAEKSKINEDLAASFFFFKADVNRNDGDRLIPTLVHQLVQSFQGLTPFVEKKILQSRDLFTKSRRDQMLELLVEPLIRLSLEETNGVQPNSELKSHPRLVVMDGLDECLDSNTQCDLIRIIADAIPHFPYPPRFLITSRPEPHIVRTFQYDVGKVFQYNLSDDSNADKDIQNFLEGAFAEIRRTHPLQLHLPSEWPPGESISSLVERSSGHFIYASTVIRFIQSPQHRPDDRLQVILGLKQPYEKERPYARLDSLYRLIFLEVQDPDQLRMIQRAFGIMYLRSLKSGLFASSDWTCSRHAIETLLGLRPGDLVLLFDRLLSLVAFDHDDIRIFHKSLFDYLLDSSRSRELQLDLALDHEIAANHILQQTKMQDGWGLPEFRLFTYHCRFARLNDTLTSHLRSLACDPKVTFTESLSKLLLSPEVSCLLQSILYFLQVIGRQDFDPGGHCYRSYVKKKIQYLGSAVSRSELWKSMIPRLPSPVVSMDSSYVKTSLSSSFGILDWSPQSFGSKGRQLTGLCGKTPVQVAKAVIKQEHAIFSSYVNARYRHQAYTVVSFLEPSADLIHSCHFVIREATFVWAIFLVLVTYTKTGIRLSCSEFDLSKLSRGTSLSDFRNMVNGHHQSLAKKEVMKELTETYTAIFTHL